MRTWVLSIVMVIGFTACFSPAGEDGGPGGGAGGSGGNTGGSGGGTGGGSGGGHAGGGSGGAGGGASDGGVCTPGCGPYRDCCGGACVNPANDPNNCGGCGIRCEGATPYCDGTCQAQPCSLGGTACGSDAGLCCGSQCCAAGQLCCAAEGPVTGFAECFTPTATDTTCPQGCAPLCVSDRDQKQGVVPADDEAVLRQLASTPIASFTEAGVKHLGTIGDPVDAHGAALSSIKALYGRIQRQQAQLEQLEAESRRLRARLEAEASCHP